MSAAPPPPEPDPAESQILRVYFGRSWRAWRWVREQFSVTSLTALGTVLAVAGGYVVHLRQDVAVVRERVVVLETRVMPVLTGESALAVLATRVDDHEARITRIESNWIDAQHVRDPPAIAAMHRRGHR